MNNSIDMLNKIFVSPDILDDYIKGYTDLINKEVEYSVSSGIGFPDQITVDQAYQLLKNYSSSRNNILLLRGDNIIIGSGVLSVRQSPVQRHVGEIKKVVVHPEYRGLRLGYKIMENLEEKALNIGLETLILDVRSHLPAVNLYKKCGFEIVGEYKNLSKAGENYYNILLMQKNLKL